MKNTNKSKRFTSLILSALIAASASAFVLGGCGDVEKKTEETKVVKETQVVTSIVEGTYATNAQGETVVPKSDNSSSSAGNSQSGNGGSKTAESSGSSGSSKTSEGSNASESSKTSGGNTQSSAGNSQSSDGNAQSSNSQQSSGGAQSSQGGNSSSSKVCKIGDKSFNVGDTVVCTYRIKCVEELVNYQAYIQYDPKYLSVETARLSEKARGGGICNFKLKDQVRFNGSNISQGYDFTKATDFITVTYKVKAGGTTSPKFVWEVATGMSDKPYVDKSSNKALSGLSLSSSYKKV